MDAYAVVATGFSSFNVILLLVLLYLYARIASKTHAGYTYGLMIFSGLLLVQNSGMAYICGFLTNLYYWQLSPYFAFVAIVESAGLLALLKVTA